MSVVHLLEECSDGSSGTYCGDDIIGLLWTRELQPFVYRNGITEQGLPACQDCYANKHWEEIDEMEEEGDDDRLQHNLQIKYDEEHTCDTMNTDFLKYQLRML